MSLKKLLYVFFTVGIGIIAFTQCNNSQKKEAKIAPKSVCPEMEKQNTAIVSEAQLEIDYSNNNCVKCHEGIAHIRETSSGMMQSILKYADTAGIKNNDCVVCHGGNPESTNKTKAHQGTAAYFKTHKGPKDFYPDPGSPWINKNTCGMCHKEQVSTQFTSLMFTEAGKIQGTVWGFGGDQGYNHDVANIETNELNTHERLGTETFKKYMATLKKAEPQIFPGKMKALPEAPTADQVKINPKLAVYTYLRQECQRCHLGVRGSKTEGDFRGTGCTSCHIPYSNKGLYEGNDPTIPKDEPGHMLVHSIQGTRDAKVTLHGNTYTGVPTKNCTSCHNRGRRIGVSYEGLMETSYASPFMGHGENQSKLHKKNYIHLQPDVHLKKGMVCQDCHTSGDIHSTGELVGAIQGAVEIECQDCHGTPKKYPWELPIGYGDEIAGEITDQTPRGVSQELAKYLLMGSENPKKDGYAITARGNPMPHVVKDGNEMILFSAGGKDIRYKPLKNLTDNDELTESGKVAMVQTQSHIDKMECYACHATWAPQCYGCHIEIDYSKPTKAKPDWVKIAKSAGPSGRTVDADLSKEELEELKEYLISGNVTEQRSFLRWEDPPLVVNGENRVSPAVPGCQTTVSVKDKDGNMAMLNHIFKVKHGENGGEDGQLAIDIAPVQPHTTQLKARSCESCHNNPKAMGFGINSGDLFYPPNEDYVMDLLDANGKVIPKNKDTQFNRIENLNMDWSRFLTENGKQLQTVGHHLSGSRPLNRQELMKLDRRGVCLSCHKDIPDGSIAVNLMSHVAKYGGVTIDNKQHSSILHKFLILSAWIQVLFALCVGFILFYLGKKWYSRRRKL